MRRELLLPVVAGVVLLAARLLPTPHNGTLGNLPSICPFKTFTTLPCPGCGLTRSVVLCAHGDWQQAFHFHPLGVVFYLALWMILAIGMLSLRFQFRPISQRAMLLTGSACAVVLVVLWIVRLMGILPYPLHI